MSDLAPVLAPHLGLDDGDLDLRAAQRKLARLAVRADGELTGVPAGPLIRVVDSSELEPAIDLPSTWVMTSPGFRPPLSAGEPS